MKAAKKISSLVFMLMVFAGVALAQGGNLAQRQKAPTVLGGTGLFNTFSTRTLCKGEFNFGLFWNNFDRDPGDLDINQVPFNFTVGLTNRWELWVDWVTWQQTTSRNPFFLSGYQYSAVQVFGRPDQLLGPSIGGKDAAAAFFARTGADFGGILPKLGAFGTPLNIPSNIVGVGVSPAGPNGPLARGLGPAFQTPLPGYYNDLPFFGEVEFLGFDSLGRAAFSPRMSSNGSGDIYVGTKYSLIDPEHHWFSMALGGYLKIPISKEDSARARGRTSGEFEYGPFLAFGQESGGKRFRLYENVGYIHTNDPEKNDVKTLDLADKLLLNVGASIAVTKYADFVAEILHTRFVGNDTPHFGEKDPVELNLGMRFFFGDGRFSFGGAYRRLLNKEDDVTLPVARFIGFTQGASNPFFFNIPVLDFPNQSFSSLGSANGFVGYASFGSRRRCPPPPAPTCVVTASAATVNRGERLTITDRPTTPGYADGKVTYDYKWDVRDASGRPVTVSGSGATIDIGTAQLPCGVYTVTTTVTATVPAVDCPSDCIVSGSTTCTTRFEVTEPPCPTVSCQVSANPSSVDVGGTVRFTATGTGDGLSYSWSTTGGRLSSTTGSEVTLDTTGLAAGTYTVTVNVNTSRTRCDQPCAGSSCTTTFAVTVPEDVRPKAKPLVPCGPIFFKFNSARINNEHKACLDEIALRMQQDPRAALVVDGHRDTAERQGISLTRANNARDYLVNEKGIDAARITIRNFGDTCAHESGDAKLNGRVEFFILPETAVIEDVDSQLKKCGAGSSPRVITDETPAVSDDKKRPVRRTPARKARKGKRGEPVIMSTQN